MPSRRVTTTIVLAAATLACGRGHDAPAVDTAGAPDVVLGADSEGQSTDTEGCVIADTTGDGRWRCRIGPRLVADVAPGFTAPDSRGVRTLRSFVVGYEGALAPARTDTLEFPDSEFMSAIESQDVSTSDLDGDGWADLRLRHHYGAAANEGHYVWRWSPATHRFAWDDLLSSETNVSADGAGCVKTFGSIGHGGQDQIESRWCLTSGTWVEVARREQEWVDSRGGPWERFYERRGDTLVVVREGAVRE